MEDLLDDVRVFQKVYQFFVRMDHLSEEVKVYWFSVFMGVLLLLK